jgi:hypothetical protein
MGETSRPFVNPVLEQPESVLLCVFLAAKDRHSGISPAAKNSTATLRDKSADYSKAKEFKKGDILQQGILGVPVKGNSHGRCRAELLKGSTNPFVVVLLP